MDTRQEGNSTNDDLLVSCKDIAAYLKCSVRKAQRLERRDLPVAPPEGFVPHGPDYSLNGARPSFLADISAGKRPPSDSS